MTHIKRPDLPPKVMHSRCRGCGRTRKEAVGVPCRVVQVLPGPVSVEHPHVWKYRELGEDAMTTSNDELAERNRSSGEPAVAGAHPTHRCSGCGRWFVEDELISTTGKDGPKDAHDVSGSVQEYCGPVALVVPKEGDLCPCGAKYERGAWWGRPSNAHWPHFPKPGVGESLESQVQRLAQFIMESIPGEPSESQGAIDTAIRLLGQKTMVILQIDDLHHLGAHNMVERGAVRISADANVRHLIIEALR